MFNFFFSELFLMTFISMSSSLSDWINSLKETIHGALQRTNFNLYVRYNYEGFRLNLVIDCIIYLSALLLIVGVLEKNTFSI